MTISRRRIIRPVRPSAPSTRRLSQLRSRLEREQRLLATWMIRLKRAFHSFEKYQRSTSRLERAIHTLETN